MHEVAWARALGQSLGNSLGALTAVLAAFLGGLGLGSMIAAGAAGRSRDPLKVYAALEGLLAICGALAPVVVWTLPRVLTFAGPACGSDRLLAVLRLGLAVAALTPSTLLMGATLPWIVRAAAHHGSPAGFTLASLYGSNTLGASAGAILGSFASLPLLGTRATFLVAGSINALAAAAALALRRHRGEAPRAPAPDTRPLPAEHAGAVAAAGRFIL